MAQPASGQELKSDKQRITNPNLNTDEQDLLLKETAPLPLSFIRRLERKKVISSILLTASHWRWR
jgi:hypothetical protein